MVKKPLIISAVLTAIFIVLSVPVSKGMLLPVEQWFYETISPQINAAATVFWKAVSFIGSSGGIIIICVALFIPAAVKKFALPAVMVSVSAIASASLNQILKVIFGRQRPDVLQLVNEESLSFPSGHSMTSAAVFLTLVLILSRIMRRGALKTAVVCVISALPPLIGYSRIYLGVHYIGDVVCGLVLGAAIAFVTFYIYTQRLNSRNKDGSENYEM